MLQNLSQSLLAEQLNTTFRLCVAPSSLEVELVELQDLGSTERHEQFSAVFREKSGVPLDQRTYRMQHDRLGEFDIFLVPIRQDQSGRYYEAIFNRMRD